MFIVTTSKDKTINWPVKVEVAADGGKIAKHEFTGVFKLLDDDEREALAAAAKAEQADTVDISEQDGAWKQRSVNNILKSMTDWKGVCDESKTPLEFNRDNLLSIARSVHGLSFLRAINVALGEVASGAKAKN